MLCLRLKQEPAARTPRARMPNVEAGSGTEVGGVCGLTLNFTLSRSKPKSSPPEWSKTSSAFVADATVKLLVMFVKEVGEFSVKTSFKRLPRETVTEFVSPLWEPARLNFSSTISPGLNEYVVLDSSLPAFPVVPSRSK